MIKFHKSEILFFLLLAFAGGVFAASVFAVSQNIILIAVALSIGIIGVSAYHNTFSRAGILAGALLFVFALGIIRFNYVSLSKSILSQFSDIEAGSPPSSKNSGGASRGVAVLLRGYIDDEPAYKNGKAQIIFRVKQIILRGEVFRVDERTIISANVFPKYQYGDFLEINGALKTPQNFDDFDYVNYLKKESVATTMSFPKIKTDGAVELGLFEKMKLGFYKKIFAVKNKFELAVSRSLAEPNASFVNGILLGSRQEIPEKLKEAFNKTGTSHILAVSGYNITIIAEAVLWALVWFFRRRKAFWLSAGLIIFFSIMTGASASVARAAIMGLLLLFASGYGRLSDAKNSIVLAGAAMVFLNPMILIFDVSFQLSFMAVLGLAFVYPLLNYKTEKISKIAGQIGEFVKSLKEIILMTLSAQFFVFPLLVYYFKNLSLVSVVANVLVLPFVPAAMLLGFLFGLAGIIFVPLGRIVGFAAWAITAYQIKVIEFFASLPFASVAVSFTSVTLIIIYPILFFGLWRMKKRILL